MGMGVQRIGNPVDIAVSGLRAEALRMKVVSNNIANANTSRTTNGQPYRRQDVVSATRIDQLIGVDTVQVHEDLSTDFKQVYEPGNPDADEKGYLRMPNIELPVEMMHMVVASRAYQANAAILKRYQEAVDVTVELLK